MILISITPSTSTPITIYVDDEPGGSPPEDYTSIQAAVDAANPGDTIFVYSGVYFEDIEIVKSIYLVGENRDSTIVNGSSSGWAIWGHDADNIHVSNFTVEDTGDGIGLTFSNYSSIKNVKAINNDYGIVISSCYDCAIENNIASNSNNHHGIYIDRSTNISVKNNICYSNIGKGIYIFDNSDNNNIVGNNCSNNADGIYIGDSSYNYISHNNLISNTNYGLFDSSSGGNIFSNNLIRNCYKGLNVMTFSQDTFIINSTIENSILYDIRISGSNTWLTAINTTFDDNKVEFGQTTNLLIVKWFLHIYVKDFLGNAIQDATVKIEDNLNGSYNKTCITNIEGEIKWLPITEYIEQDTTGDTIGEKTYYTPHRIISWNDTLVGYVYPEPFINETKTINIILYNGTLVEMDNNNWNMISIPRIQSDMNLEVVLQSIEGRYKSVQWYDASDINDNWKHYCNSKPPIMNDLKKLNHTMGLWIDITDFQGTTLIIFGDRLTSNQTIPLYPGWNLIGFPSSSDKLVSESLNGISYGSDVDAIWSFNSTTQEWIELGLSDYFEVGHGYWIHSKVEENWEIPV